MAIDVFSRHEIKYLIDAVTLVKLQDRLADHMVVDAYIQSQETYSITNLYYDTDDSYLIRTSLQKPTYKEKLRLRAYGVPSLDDKVYIEIKKKVDGTVNKRRSAIRLADAYAFTATGSLPEASPMHNRQVLREISYFLHEYALKPRLYLAYERRAWSGTDRKDLRISFDTRIRTRRERLALEAGDDGELLLPEGQWLMEIKTANSMPIWLTRLLAEYRVFPTSFSKYGFEYKQMLARQERPSSTIFIPSLIPIPAGAVHAHVYGQP